MSSRMLFIPGLFLLALAACAPAAGPGAPQGNETGGTFELVESLRSDGASAERAGEIEQPFFSVKGSLIEVNDLQVQVFEYPDERRRERESEPISSDGSSIGTTMITWIDQPNFWARGRLIVLFVGSDAELIELLTQALGPPITAR